jgi:hypothetical protein
MSCKTIFISTIKQLFVLATKKHNQDRYGQVQRNAQNSLTNIRYSDKNHVSRTFNNSERGYILSMNMQQYKRKIIFILNIVTDEISQKTKCQHTEVTLKYNKQYDVRIVKMREVFQSSGLFHVREIGLSEDLSNVLEHSFVHKNIKHGYANTQILYLKLCAKHSFEPANFALILFMNCGKV